jgi:thiaminase
MAEASKLIERIKGELAGVAERIERHRYVEALERGVLPRESLAVFAAQQYGIITSDLRSIALLTARHGHLPSRVFLLQVLQGESAALDGLAQFAAALGLSCSELAARELLPGAQAYSHYLAWLCAYGSDAEFAAAVLVNFPAWGGNCARISRALQQHYGLGKVEVAFFDLFASLPPLDEQALPVIEAGLQRGVSPDALARAARFVQAYELMYWDAMAEAAGV